MAMYGGNVVGAKAIWNTRTGYHAQFYGGPLIGGIPDPMDVRDDAPTTAEVSASTRKKSKSGNGDFDE